MTRIDLPWTSPPLNSNKSHRSSNVHAKAGAVRIAKAQAGKAIRDSRIGPIDCCIITLNYRAPDRRRRDADNLAATYKVCQDALVLVGVLTDDSWQTVPESRQRIHPPEPGKPGALWIEIEEVP